MKLKKSNFDEAQKFKMIRNSKTPIVIKVKNSILIKLQILNCDKTQKLKL